MGLFSRAPKKYIFVHMPRTGGTSLNRMIADCFPEGTTRKIKSYEPFQTQWLEGEWQCLHGHMNWPNPRLLDRRTYVVCVLRHPSDRVISWYKYLGLMQPDTATAEKNAALPLEQHRDAILQFAAKPENRNAQAKIMAGIYTGAVDPLTQPEPLSDDALLKKARRNLKRRRTVIGTTETYDDFIATLKRKHGWNLPDQPLKAGVSPGLGALEGELRTQIESLNAVDLALWQHVSQRCKKKAA